ncbi:MAG TPA: hypothetical protein VJ869_07555 [Sphaerochaeta sp.]|nr:hypothetical protein [Sphaerochaeta sp.]
MRRISLLCILLLSLFGCSTTGGVSEERAKDDILSFLDLSGYAANVYVGISGPYSSKERMVEEAILSCAKSILLEKALAVDSTLVMQESSNKGLVSFAQKEKAYYDDESLKAVVEALVVLSIDFDAHAGSIVFSRYPEGSPVKRSYKAKIGSALKPDWLDAPPEVDGYRFGIGSSKAYYFLNDSLEAADFAAAQNLLDLKAEHVFSKSLNTTREGTANSMDSVLFQAQRGLLLGFTIVDRFYDKESDTYWSLASITE